MIEQAAVHQLMPGDQQAVLINWPLYKKNGAHTLYAVADIDHAVTEANAGNNSARADVLVPDLLLGVSTAKSSFSSDEDIAATFTAVNLTNAPYKNLAVTLQFLNPAGIAVNTEMIKLDELSPGKELRLDRSFRPAALPHGTYKLAVLLSRETPLASKAIDLSILPTLAVTGTLDNMPEAAARCRPFTLQYKAASTGNIPVSTGSLAIEISGAKAAQPLFMRKLPFTEKTSTPDHRQRGIIAGDLYHTAHGRSDKPAPENFPGPGAGRAPADRQGTDHRPAVKDTHPACARLAGHCRIDAGARIVRSGHEASL